MPSAPRALVLAALSALAACSPPGLVKPYRMEIQQGNYISQDMVSQLRPGMSKDQVRFVLGTPLVTDIFHADRWDYVYFRDIQGRGREERKIAVIFEDGKLARIVGDVVPAAPKGDTAPPKDAAPPNPAASPAVERPPGQAKEEQK
ncbi:MAG: outer membrane protein assembly factor BamE [Betaproteobacteria bacterium]|nr:outer membrane protein assembly factor BamE [Betaproteobacteria bacterium]